jgi:hypothetical protein
VSLASLVSVLALAACPADESASPTPLSRVEPGAPSEVCPDGGTTVNRGLDENDNGILDDAEVDDREYVCDAPPAPPPGGEVLTVSVEEPAGVHCKSGGTRVDSGVDQDQDGQLDAEEIDRTEYICDGVETPESLTSLASEPPGEHCAAGGVVTHTGVDDDGDGVLDANEIDHSAYDCDGVLVGDYDIDSPQAAEALAGVQVITGNLNIDPADILYHYDIVLPDLRIVGGDVVSNAPSYLDSFSAPELVSIGGDLAVYSESRIDGLHLPKLAEVNGYVYVMSLQLDSIALPALERVGGPLNLTAGGELVDLSALRTVGGRLEVHSDTRHLLLPELVSAGALDLSGTPDLVELRAPKLRKVDRSLRIGSSDALTTLDFSQLAIVGWDLHVVGAPVDTLAFPVLEAVGGELLVFHASTRSIAMPRLKTVKRLKLSWLGLTALDLPALEQADEIEILRQDALVSIAAPKLRTIGTLWLSHMPALVDLSGLGGLETAGSMTIAHCAALVDLSDLAGLEEVGIFGFGSNHALVSLGLPALRTVTDYLSIGLPFEGNLALEQVDLPALVSANAILIEGNHALTRFQLPALTGITAVLRAQYNDALPQCVVDELHASLSQKPVEYDVYHNDGVCPR